MAEGRYPNVYVSFSIAEAVGQPETYIRNRGLDDEKCKAFILKTLETTGPINRGRLMQIVGDVLPDVLSTKQKEKKLTNLLQVMKKKDGTIDSVGKTRQTVWFIQNQQI